HNAIKLHRVSCCLGLHRRRHGVQVRYVHHQRYPVRILWIDECSDVGHAEGTEKLFTRGRSEPVLRTFCNVMMGDYCWHSVLPYLIFLVHHSKIGTASVVSGPFTSFPPSPRVRFNPRADDIYSTDSFRERPANMLWCRATTIAAGRMS